MNFKPFKQLVSSVLDTSSKGALTLRTFSEKLWEREGYPESYLYNGSLPGPPGLRDRTGQFHYVRRPYVSPPHRLGARHD